MTAWGLAYSVTHDVQRHGNKKACWASTHVPPWLVGVLFIKCNLPMTLGNGVIVISAVARWIIITIAPFFLTSYKNGIPFFYVAFFMPPEIIVVDHDCEQIRQNTCNPHREALGLTVLVYSNNIIQLSPSSVHASLSGDCCKDDNNFRQPHLASSNQPTIKQCGLHTTFVLRSVCTIQTRNELGQSY